MDIFLISYVGLIGLMVGSFLNVCIYRIPIGQSIVFPPSYCTRCGSSLKVRDLIPIISYLLLKGRCRYCGERISPVHPLIELLNAALWVLLFIVYRDATPDFLKFALLASILLVVSAIDIKIYIINNVNVLLILAMGIIFLAYELFSSGSGQIIGILINYCAAMPVGGGVLLLIALVTRGKMGGGDIKLMFATGLILGLKLTIIAIELAFVIGGVVSVFLLLRKAKKRGEMVPFGPFIAAGVYCAVLFGEPLADWYLTLIG